MSWPASGHYVVDPSRSLVKVFTFKKGLLSAMGHDLEMHTRELSGELELDGEEGEVSCRIQLWNLSILPSVLDGFQKREAESTMRKKVLKKEARAVAEYTAEVSADGTLEGTLSLLGGRGVSTTVNAKIAAIEDDGFRATASHTFKQTAYGIKPYKGMMGALQLKDEMRVEVEVFFKKG